MCKKNGVFINQVDKKVMGDYFTIDDLKSQAFVDFYYFDKIAIRKLY